jgi:hypothetical protein
MPASVTYFNMGSPDAYTELSGRNSSLELRLFGGAFKRFQTIRNTVAHERDIVKEAVIGPPAM